MVDIGNTIKDAFQGGGPWLTVGDVEVTASISEIHSFEAEITDHPVEDGGTISDHYYRKPIEFKFEGVVSDVKLETGFPGQSLVEAFRVGLFNDPALEAWHTILGYYEDAREITVVSSLQTYEPVMIKQFSVTRDKNSTASTLRFTGTVRKVTIVSTEETAAIEIPETQDPSLKQGKAAEKGKKNPKDASGAQAAKVEKTSLLKQGLSGLF